MLIIFSSVVQQQIALYKVHGAVSLLAAVIQQPTPHAITTITVSTSDIDGAFSLPLKQPAFFVRCEFVALE